MGFVLLQLPIKQRFTYLRDAELWCATLGCLMKIWTEVRWSLMFDTQADEQPYNMYSFWLACIPSIAQEKLGPNFLPFGGKNPPCHHRGGLYKSSRADEIPEQEQACSLRNACDWSQGWTYIKLNIILSYCVPCAPNTSSIPHFSSKGISAPTREEKRMC